MKTNYPRAPAERRLTRIASSLGIAAALVAVVACGRSAPEPSPEERLVRDYFAAFNRSDAGSMTALVASAVELYSVHQGEVSLDLIGRDLLRRALDDNFRSTPGVRSSADRIVSSGPWVVVHERLTWKAQDGAHDEDAIDVFEVRDGKIRRIWYFPPAHRPRGTI